MANNGKHLIPCLQGNATIIPGYTEPLDTIDQMVESDLPFYIGGTASVWLAKTDLRNSVRKLNDRRVAFTYI